MKQVSSGNTLNQIHAELTKVAEPEKAAFFPKFFQAQKGGYGEGDRFLGVRIPHQRKIAKKYWNQVSDSELKTLLRNEFHEKRMVGIFILIHQFEKAKSDSEQEKKVNIYLENLVGINNWDLVDSSAYKILGPWLEKRPREILYSLADSGDLWKERIAIQTCLHFIKKDDYRDTLKFSKKFLTHKHDLIHKATGWMLREVCDRDRNIALDFLRQHHSKMPRTMLRYAIEKLDEPLRKKILAGAGF